MEPDQNLTEMANRLESSLRRSSEPRVALEPPAPDKDAPAETPPEPSAPLPQPQPARTEAKPTPSKTLYDSLEEEMASLLGRPPGKT